MNQNTNPLHSKDFSQNPHGILHLPPPPEPWKITEWYGSTIAGVPFLLRNILTLQRSGLQDIIIYLDAPDIKTLAHSIGEDSRILAKIHWVSDSGQLKEALKNQKCRVLLFNGSTLHDKKEVRSLLQTFVQEETKTPEVSPLSNEQLDSLIEKIQLNDEKKLEESFENAHSFTYIPGSAKNRIQGQKDFSALHEQLLKGSGQNHDSTITRLLSRPVSRKLTRFFLDTPISPNQITLLSFAMGLASALCFAQGTYQMNVFGGLLLLFSTWVDGTDGEIARLKFMESELGGKLDILCDNIVHFFVFGAIGWGVSEATGDKTYMYLGGLAAIASLTAFILLGASIVKKSSQTSTPPTEAQPSLADKLANRDFVNFLMLMTLIDFMHVFIFIAAIGSTFFAVYLTYLRVMELRSLKNP